MCFYFKKYFFSTFENICQLSVNLKFLKSLKNIDAAKRHHVCKAKEKKNHTEITAIQMNCWCKMSSC